MTKKLLITCLPTNPKVKNIGDYIQTLAVKQYAKHWDGYLDRERTNTYKSNDVEKSKVVFNGCYIRDSRNWPPSDNIIPLFTSLHIFPFIAEELLTPNNIEYFKAHAPIGCRDLGTLNFLNDKGVPAFYSACLTLTLGDTYQHVDGGNLLFVDPILPDLKEEKKVNLLCSVIKTTIANFLLVKRLYKNKYFHRYSEWGYRESSGITDKLRTMLYVCKFIDIYSAKFEKSAIRDASFLTNMYSYPATEKTNDDFFMKVADEYLKIYSRASLVVTSRIHAALPCLAINTPVIFVVNDLLESSEIKFNTPGRFDGIIDLFRTFKMEKNNLKTSDEVLMRIKKIDKTTDIHNKENWKPFAEKLKKQVIDFFADESV